MSNESFGDNEVIELPETGTSAVDIESNPQEDTFSNEVYQDGVDKDSQVSLLEEEKVDDGSQKDEKGGEEKKPEVEGSKKEDQKSEGKEETEAEEKPAGKTVRFKDGDKSIDISPEATIKVKVKGKSEFVTLEDLKSDYSGRKAWTEDIEVAKTKTADAESRTAKLTEEKQEIAGHLTKIADMLDREDGDPLEALHYLLDITGRDANTYNKRVYDFMQKNVEAMSEMDDVEQELYWNKRKLESIENNQAAKAETIQNENAHRALIQNVDRIRESQDVSEDQYVEAHSELVGLGLSENDIRPEQVVEYAVLKPFAEKAEAITYEYRDELGDDELDALTTEITNVMRKRPTISDEKALSIAAQMLGYEVESVDDHINNLNDKGTGDTSYKQPTKVAEGDPNAVESFDDFNY